MNGRSSLENSTLKSINFNNRLEMVRSNSSVDAEVKILLFLD